MAAVGQQLESPPTPFLEARAAELGAAHSAVLPGRSGPVRRRLARVARELRALYARLEAAPPEMAAPGYATEWLLDNRHVVGEALLQISESLPRRFERELPRLATSEADEPRVLALAGEVLRVLDRQPDVDAIVRFTAAYQTETPLSMGELWALPTMLRLRLLEEIARSARGLASADEGRSEDVDAAGVATCVVGLRALTAHDWRPFFESVSRVDGTLRTDAADVYRWMDFASRDLYRQALERIARETGRGDGEGEDAVARAAVDLSRGVPSGNAHGAADAHAGPSGDGAGRPPPAGADADRRRHVGWYLVDGGREELLRVLGGPRSAVARGRRWLRRHGAGVYLTGVLAATALLLGVVVLHAAGAAASGLQLAALALLALVPSATVSVSVANWIVTHAVRPRTLPKLDFEDGVPASCRTLVVVPCILGSDEDVLSQLRELEVNYLGNSGPHVSFALLGDPPDASAKELPGDDRLVELARAGLRELNRRHAPASGPPPFLLLHRERRWNPREGRWMGWERKRGKLEELNRLLLGAGETSFAVREGPIPVPGEVRYVITADADTFLPPGAAARLVATLAHPLHRPECDSEGRVRWGYTVLQPRLEIIPEARRTFFSWVFEADRGIDLYTHAVSDVYQDLAGEGSYAGKGIYDVRAFARSLEGRVPENTLLSHDLFEGVHGRAGLVSDVTLFEQYPRHVLTYMRRLHRWIRGDWQILPWLADRVPGTDGRRVPTRLGPLDRWKIVDNLRRSLVAPSLLGLLGIAWLWLPHGRGIWTAFALVVLGTPVILQGAATLNRVARGRRTPDEAWPHEWRHLRPAAIHAFAALWTDLARWGLAVAFLAYEAVVVSDAILRTLWRMTVSRRRLLEWTTAAHSARALESRADATLLWRRMAVAPALGVAAIAVALALRPAALPLVLPFALLWIASPQIAYAISRPRSVRAERLSLAERREMRMLARRTWLFFQHFIGPADHWLPPDNFQEEPGGIVARRTSPTNVGFSLLSMLAAHDLGYVGPVSLSASLRNTLETLERLERHRGHFFNWYDTRTLEPLLPRYVSTVDSGNLAAALLAVGRGAARLGSTALLRPEQAEGVLDTLAHLPTVLAGIDVPELRPAVREVEERVLELRDRVIDEVSGPREWVAVLRQLSDDWLPQLEERVVTLAEAGARRLEPGLLRELRIWSTALRDHVWLLRHEVEGLVPWAGLLEVAPALYRETGREDDVTRAFGRLVQELPAQTSLAAIPRVCRRASGELARLEASLGDGARAPADAEVIAGRRDVPGPATLQAARDWNARLAAALLSASDESRRLLDELRETGARCEALAGEMRFGFLYDARRFLFHIGYNASAGDLDHNYYDLLASEARLASFLAIANGDVAPEHWLHLGRPFTRIDGRRSLLSWGGTMFEFLMPPLLMRTPPGSLLEQSGRVAIDRQIDWAARRGVPWGVSESGYAQLDPQGNYQYRAFGVPGLGLKRGLGERLVVSPYASLLALPWRPRAVAANVARLRRQGALGRYGLYEALDYGRSGANGAVRVVRSYMAHHQGMILVALDNHLSGFPMVSRFHASPRVVTVEHLLHEQVPWHAPFLQPVAQHGERRTPLLRPAGLRPWRAHPQFPVPQTHMLSNGRYAVLLTAAGGGQSRWRDVALTRWRADPTCESWGSWIYVQDVGDGWLGAASAAPVGAASDAVETWFAPHLAEFHRREHGLAVRILVTVPPGEDLEIRHVRVVNDTNRPRRIALVSCAEVCLARQEDDRRHPAFHKLFVESEALPERNALFFRRRARSADEEPVRLAHAVVTPSRSAVRVSWETDRARFLGRWGSPRRPEALQRPGPLSGTTGATLDAVAALRCELALGPHADAELVFLTVAGGTRAEVLAQLDAYGSVSRVQWAFQQARTHAELELHELGVPPERAHLFQELLSALLHAGHELRDRGAIAANVLPRRELWRHGVSGDHPILLVRVEDEEATALVAETLQAHAWWRRCGLKIDLVLLTQDAAGYAHPVRDRVSALVHATGGAAWLDQPGGIFLLPAAALMREARVQLAAAAAVVLDAGLETLDGAVSRLAWAPTPLPAFVPMPSSPLEPEPTPPTARPQGLLFDNGRGGFSADGREYVTYIEKSGPAARPTPAPWINVVARPDFGFVVSEAGSGCTWSEHSAENRLTPWRNDPVADDPGEALYLRDEETADLWSPTPLPAGVESAYLVRHGAGYTVFEHASHGLVQELRLFVAPDAPVKLAVLRLRNLRDRPRRVTATWYAEWVLGESREVTGWQIVPEYDHATGALLARNAMNEPFERRVAFLVSGSEPHGVTADRKEFLGRNGDLRAPAALHRIGLSGRVEPGDDACAVLQVHVDLAPGEEKLVHFALGQGAGREEALSLASRFRDAAAVEEAWTAALATWDWLLGAVQVRTPEPALDLMLNRWLLYQTISCRFWGRTALYQSSGAFGFRDQLQDALALLHVRPEWTRAHLLECARHQFEEGDVLHWWHPPLEAGVRTRCSDDLLWLPYAAAAYVEATGDASVLDEEVPFLSAPTLAHDEEDRYASFPAGRSASLQEHCLRALARGTTAGPHGLPLIGAHDWNDGLSRVGHEGRGESVWLAWFLIEALQGFARVCDRIGDAGRAADLRESGATVRRAVEAAGWDGAWYRRAYYDDGTPLGSASSREARIDSIAQSWAVLTGAAEPERARRAMTSVEEWLVRPLEGGGGPPLLPLFWPPFDRTQRDPGYVKGYPPGVRENGGQYNHAAVWVGWAFAALGEGGKALDAFRSIVPVLRAGTPAGAARYRVEPYVTAADVYSAPPHEGRGGWTWYTGSAGWTYRLGLEAILGIRREGAALRLAPRVPREWSGYEVSYRFGTAEYRIRVSNGGAAAVLRRLVVDGEERADATVPLVDDGRVHEVEVTLE